MPRGEGQRPDKYRRDIVNRQRKEGLEAKGCVQTSSGSAAQLLVRLTSLLVPRPGHLTCRSLET
jgi:hypothetical protein